MNVSSYPKSFYPTNESRNLLKTIRRLKREVSRFGDNVSDPIGYNRLLKDIDAMEASLRLHFKELTTMEEALVSASSQSLTDKQKVMLRWLTHNCDGETVYTVLIERLSEDLRIPKSTVRWNLRGLRDASLIRAGDRENKGVPVRLTEAGRLMASYAVADDD